MLPCRLCHWLSQMPDKISKYIITSMKNSLLQYTAMHSANAINKDYMEVSLTTNVPLIIHYNTLFNALFCMTIFYSC